MDPYAEYHSSPQARTVLSAYSTAVWNSTHRTPSCITNCCYICQTLKNLFLFLPSLAQLKTLYFAQYNYTTLLHPFNSLFSRTTWVSWYQKGKTSLDLNQAGDDGVLGWLWHQLHHMQTICTSLQTDNHTNPSSLNFYRPDALLDAQPTASKHHITHTPV